MWISSMTFTESILYPPHYKVKNNNSIHFILRTIYKSIFYFLIYPLMTVWISSIFWLLLKMVISSDIQTSDWVLLSIHWSILNLPFVFHFLKVLSPPNITVLMTSLQLMNHWKAFSSQIQHKAMYLSLITINWGSLCLVTVWIPENINKLIETKPYLIIRLQ